MRYGLLLIYFIFYSFSSLSQGIEGQENPSQAGNLSVPADSTVAVIKNDTLNTVFTDSVAKNNLPPPNKDIETTIVYSARDSIKTSINGQKLWLYGDAEITYGEIKLQADEIEIDYGKSTLIAHGRRDSTGARIGYPVFTDKGTVYETRDIKYNFETGRAQISEVVTQQGEGYLHVEQAYKNEHDEMFSRHNAYTTCNLEEPHFQIISTKAKAIPNDKIVSGPFYMEFNGIPLPLGFLFGMFPAERESKSGIIFPSYGEERRRGFNLSRGGYFFDINEYIKLAVTGDLFSKGSHGIYVDSDYKKRYHYNGGFNLSYTKNIIADRIESPSTSIDYVVRWNHTPQSKGTSRFSASVQYATASFNQNNNLSTVPLDINSSRFSNITAKLNSRISYTKSFPRTPFSMTLNGSLDQDLKTRKINLPFPTLAVNMKNQYPFQSKSGNGPGYLENFSIGYKMNSKVQLTNDLGRITPEATHDSIADFNSENLPLFLRRATKGFEHDIPISTTHKLFKYFNISPSVNYSEKWYFESLDWHYETVGLSQVLVPDTIRGFNRIANYNFGASLTTRIFGMYKFKRGNVQAIRHTINPSVSFGYTPDFTTNEKYFQVFTSPTTGKPQLKSRHERFAYGPSDQGKNGSIGLNVGNTLEMKVRRPEDSVSRKIMLLNSLQFGTRYNMVADSFKLSTVNISGSSNILDNLISLSFGATLDPYRYIKNTETGVESRIDELAILGKGGGLGRFTDGNLTLRTNFNPAKRKKNKETQEKIVKSELPEQDKQYLLDNPDAYIDFEIPWSLSLSYTVRYSHNLNNEPKISSHSLQGSGDLSLSESWKITFNSGYDVLNKRFSTTTLSLARDIHCWTMSLNWVPFGPQQSFHFTLRAKSSLLQDLKLERRKPFWDNL